MPEDRNIGLEPNAEDTVADQESEATPEKAVAQEGREPEQEQFSAEYVRKLRREAADYRKRLRELEQRVQQYEEEKLSETERLQKRLAEAEREITRLQQERQERLLKYEVQLAAGKLGIIDPDAAYRLLDLNLVEFDDDGEPQNIEKLLRDLVAEKPYLVAGSGVSPTNPARSVGSPPVFTRSQLRDPKFFQAHRDAIMQAVREGRIVEE